MTTTNDTSSQPIVVCHDDHYYHPHTLAILDQYSHEFKNSIVGLRGWRIRKDLIWAVSDPYHLIQSYNIAEVYRVGVTTAKRNIALYVVPFCCAHLGVFRTDALSAYLNARGISRAKANDHALDVFKTYWENDLWYEYVGVNAPRSYSWLTGINRKWNVRIQKMMFTRRFGHINV